MYANYCPDVLHYMFDYLTLYFFSTGELLSLSGTAGIIVALDSSSAMTVLLPFYNRQ